MKRFIAILIIVTFIPAFNAFAVSKNEPLKKISKGLDNVVYGSVEVPDSINETNSKGTPAFPECTADTKKDIGRGIARVVGGLWQLATFWYPSDSE